VFNLCRSRAARTVFIGLLSLSPTVPAQITQGNRDTKTVKINLKTRWTDTQLKVAKGEILSVAATGEMNWYTGGCPGTGPGGNCTVTPDGRDWSVCESFAGSGFVEGKLNCWSLIGQVGDGPAFNVGASLRDFPLPASGELYLGVNDNNYGDTPAIGRPSLASRRHAPLPRRL
jgi:hypothetical protein